MEKDDHFQKWGGQFRVWSNKSSYAHGVGCWKYILAHLELFKTLVHFKVRNSSRVLLWHDVWCGDHRLNFLIFLEWLVSKMKRCRQ